MDRGFTSLKLFVYMLTVLYAILHKRTRYQVLGIWFNASFPDKPGSMHGFGVNGMTGGDPGITMTHPAYAAQPGSAHMMMSSYPPPPSYCNHPPPSYEQIFQNSDKK
ncbi:unnamed protein product [Pleuronectes platessa]|uniref:Vesicular, overexpressed in cancer, prosurvival protein 1 n=1 Tax=Pleuronectes platessa TaxID=8262 RepID=A0A9N7TWX7_PLEPL|nr:unnamed protein product [Pleuronectes platessa]